jgi:hypothetical protein
MTEENVEEVSGEESEVVEEVSETYEEDKEELEYVPFSPLELELFISRSEIWDKLVKGELGINEAKKMIEELMLKPLEPVMQARKGSKKRRRQEKG